MLYNMSSRSPLVGFVFLIIVCVLVALTGLVAAQKDPVRPELTVPLVPEPSGAATDIQDDDSSRPATMQLNPAACGGSPYSATDETTLNNAIACVNAAGAGTFTIDISANITLTGHTTAIDTADADEIIIDGNDNTVDGDSKGLVFEVKGGSIVSFKDITITKGSGDSYGGGIAVAGEDTVVTITDSTLSHNEAPFGGDGGGGGLFVDYASKAVVENSKISDNKAQFGGGIWVLREAELTITNSTVSNNKGNSSTYSPNVGGGLLVTLMGTASVDNSTFSGNEVNFGGGIYALESGSEVTITNSTISANSVNYGGLGGGVVVAYGSKMMIENSTVTGNTADGGVGGGIFEVDAELAITNSTISDNSAREGAGIGQSYGTVTVTNTIVALQASGGDDCTATGSIASGGYNIESSTSCGFTGIGDQQIVTDTLKLQPLADNGGDTLTMALDSGSVAID
ncbi:MAG: right-handed parallel beta-helix repeat-containing protein, partial [Chloroflexi bacterium]|nr:right-handed parallel beta-helix repeat-containing protein [Chloroflexota bacterium]